MKCPYMLLEPYIKSEHMTNSSRNNRVPLILTLNHLSECEDNFEQLSGNIVVSALEYWNSILDLRNFYKKIYKSLKYC
jgi:hypothetical protein